MTVESNVYWVIIQFNRYSLETFVSHLLPDWRRKRKTSIFTGQRGMYLLFQNDMPFKWDFSQISSLAASSSKYDCKLGGFIFLFQTNRPETRENRERSSYFFDFPTETVVRAELVETKRKKLFFFADLFSVLYIINPCLHPILLSVVRMCSSRR